MSSQGRPQAPYRETGGLDGYVPSPRALVVGLGGAGSEALRDLEELGLPSTVETLAVNTDGRHLQSLPIRERILLGQRELGGRGSGGDRSMVSRLAADARDEFSGRFRRHDLTFLLAGLGGGTGSALLPYCMDLSRQAGSLPIPVAFLPFRVEMETNPVRRENTLSALGEIERQPGLILVLANEKLRRFENQPLKRILEIRNTYVHKLVLSLVDILESPSEINLDLALLRRHVAGAGISTLLVAEGHASEPDRLLEQALREGFLDFEIRSPGPTLLHVEGGSNLTLRSLNRLLEVFRAGFHEPREFAFGARIREERLESVRVTAIVGGIGPRSVEEALGL